MKLLCCQFRSALRCQRSFKQQAVVLRMIDCQRSVSGGVTMTRVVRPIRIGVLALRWCSLVVSCLAGRQNRPSWLAKRAGVTAFVGCCQVFIGCGENFRRQ